MKKTCDMGFMNLDGSITQFIMHELGEFGQVVMTYDKMNRPYSYDSFIMWGKPSKEAHTVYSDRLYQWDFKKYNKICKKVFGNVGQYFNHRDPKLIEKFLSLYFDKKLKLHMIEEHCNKSNGYPLWRFDYEEIK